MAIGLGLLLPGADAITQPSCLDRHIFTVSIRDKGIFFTNSMLHKTDLLVDKINVSKGSWKIWANILKKK